MFVPQPHAAPPTLPLRADRARVATPRVTDRSPRVETDRVELLVTDPSGERRTVDGYLAVVDGRLFLRPRGGRRCAWVRARGRGCSVELTLRDAAVPVTLLSVRDGEVQRRVSEALIERFGYHPAMPALLDDASLSATVELRLDEASPARSLAA